MTKSVPQHPMSVAPIDAKWQRNNPTGDASNEGLTAEHAISDMRQGVVWSADELDRRQLVRRGMSQQRVIKAFRELRTRLIERCRQSASRVIMVVPVGDSASSANLVAKNLAVAFTMSPDNTAVFVDCGFAHSAEKSLISERVKLGITDYLSGDGSDIADLIHETGVERLRAVPTGHAGDVASESLHSPRAAKFFDELKLRYHDRYTIIAAPPSEHMVEFRLLSAYVDLVVPVVGYGAASANMLNDVIDAIDKNKLAGVVYSEV